MHSWVAFAGKQGTTRLPDASTYCRCCPLNFLIFFFTKKRSDTPWLFNGIDAPVQSVEQGYLLYIGMEYYPVILSHYKDSWIPVTQSGFRILNIAQSLTYPIGSTGRLYIYLLVLIYWYHKESTIQVGKYTIWVVRSNIFNFNPEPWGRFSL